MQKYHIKSAMANFLSLDSNDKYTIESIKYKIYSMNTITKHIKKSFPDFKGCSCTSTQCKMNVDAFFNYIINNHIIDNGIPDCSFYFSSNETPCIINSDSFTFV